MQARIALTIAMLVANFVAFFDTDNGFAQDKYAVLIGVESYNEEYLGQLQFTEEDAEGLANSLRAIGFDTKVMTGNAISSTLKPTTPDKILRILETQMNSCVEGDTILISLSGHGLQYGDEALIEDGTRETYFCPEDADPTDKSTLLRISEVVKLLKNCPATRKLLLIDACRNDFNETEGQRKAGRRLNLGSVHETRQSVPGGMTVMFSCDQNQYSWEHKELGHSVFSYFVMEYLNGKAESQFYNDSKIHLDGMTSFVRKKTNEYVFNNSLSSQGQSPVRSGTSSDWVLGQSIDPVRLILGKHLDFIGGADTLGNVDTFKIYGTHTKFSSNGRQRVLSVSYQGRNQSVLQTYASNEGTANYGYTPKASWTVDAGGKTNAHSPGDHWANTMMMRYPFSAKELLQRANEFKLGKATTINGAKTTELIIQHPSEARYLKWYIADSGQLMAIEFPPDSAGQTTQVRFSDYKSFQGIRIPMRETVYEGGKVASDSVFSSATINTLLDASLFRVPANLEKQFVNTKSFDVDQLIREYESRRTQYVVEWSGNIVDVRFKRVNDSTVRVEYFLSESAASKVYEASSAKAWFIKNALTPKEIGLIKQGLSSQVYYKNSIGKVICQFTLSSNDF